jgi:tetratricopeptide (TPR) repeat protein
MNSAELIKQGQDLMRTLQLPEAERAFQKALNLDASSVGALVWLGRIAMIQNQNDEAMQFFDHALVMQPNSAETIALKAVHFMKSEQFDRAIELLEQAKSADPNLEMIYFNLGKCYQEIGEFRKAEEALRKTILLDPSHFQAYAQLSKVLAQTERMNEGIQAMLKAIRINPLYLKGYLVIGNLYKKAGKDDLVIRLYRSGLRYNPNAVPLREELCAIYISKRDFRNASRQALEIIRIRNGAEDYLRLGNIAVQMGKFKEAEQIYKTALEIIPTSWETHYNLAELYLITNSMDQARVHYQAAVENNFTSYKPFNGLGYFELMVNQNSEKAIRMFKQALEQAPQQPEPKLNIALAYSSKREFLLAEKYAREAAKATKPETQIHKEAMLLLKKIAEEKRK